MSAPADRVPDRRPSVPARGAPGLAFALWGAAGTLAAPAIRLLLRRRLRTGKEIAGRLGERRGVHRTPRPAGRMAWLHGASIGETLSLLPLIAALCRQQPELSVLLTTGTATAQRLAVERLADTPFGRRVLVRFVPLDVPAWTGRFLDHWRPDLAVLVESELWPTLIAGCARRLVPLALVNARLSERSARRWRMAGPVGRQLFDMFGWISARSEQDAARLHALGVAGVEHDGDLKQAADPLPFDADELARLRGVLGDRPCWLAASTHDAEEETVLALHAVLSTRHPGLLTVIAPRHPERGDAIAALSPGMRRRSRGEDPAQEGGVWLCDTLGELGLLYRLAGIVLLGNSLASVNGPAGGHNPLEPARLDCALAAGPRMQNFAEDVADLVAAGGLAVLPDRPALLDWLDRMLRRPEARSIAAAAASSVCGRQAGLPDRLARRLLCMLAEPAA